VESRERTLGYLAIVLAAVLFGVWPTISKLVLVELHPLAVSFLIQVIPGVLLAPSLVRYRPPRRDARMIVLTACAGAVLGPIVYFYGLELTTAANSVLLSNSESLFTMLFAYALLKERAAQREYVALAGIGLGAFLVATQFRFGDVRFLEYLLGNALLVVAASLWALSNTGSTILLRRIPIVPLLAMQLLIGAAVLGPVVLATGASLAVPASVLPLVVLLSLSAVAGFSILFFYAFRTIGALRTGAVLPSSALWGVLLALAVFPEETLNEWQVLGGVLMIGSLLALYVLRGPGPAGRGETLKPAAPDGPESP
jgi:drug/metabolite transporter (DMT)-like permease